MVRIAHLADTHLGLKQYNLDEREKDIYDSLEEVGNKILEERADIVIHSGDLFDSPRPTPQAYLAFKRFLEKLTSNLAQTGLASRSMTVRIPAFTSNRAAWAASMSTCRVL